jgi:hypothetical protein
VALSTDWASLPIGDRHDLRPLAAFRLAHARASSLGGRETPVDECFLQIQMAFVVKCLCENLEDARWNRSHGVSVERTLVFFRFADSPTTESSRQ